MAENIKEYMIAKDIILMTCSKCGIPSFSNFSDFSDKQIISICNRIALDAPDTSYLEDNTPVVSIRGVDTMLFIAITGFPKFFGNNNLWMIWRN